MTAMTKTSHVLAQPVGPVQKPPVNAQTAKQIAASKHAATIAKVSGATTYSQARSVLSERKRRAAITTKYHAGSYFAALDARAKHIAHRDYVAKLEQKYGVGTLSEAIAARAANKEHRNFLLAKYGGQNIQQARVNRAQHLAKSGISTPSSDFFQLLPSLFGSGTASDGDGGPGFSADSTGDETAKPPGAVNSLVIIAGAGVLLLLVLKHRHK